MILGSFFFKKKNPIILQLGGGVITIGRKMTPVIIVRSFFFTPIVTRSDNAGEFLVLLIALCQAVH